MPTQTSGRLRLRHILIGVFTLAYAVYYFRMTRAGFHGWFSEDDLMNLWFARDRGVPALLKGLAVFWGSYTRPLGQAYYLTLYRLGGFDPALFNFLRWLMVAFNVVLLVFFVRRLSDSWNTARLALVLGGCNAAMFALYFDSGMIYDVLAFLFYYLTLWLYTGIRRRAGTPSLRQLLGLALLYMCALESKEIAVSLPFAILLYELVMDPVGSWKPSAIWKRLTGPGRFVIVSGLMSLAFVIGKVTLGDLYKMTAYHPHYSPRMYLSVYGNYLIQFVNCKGFARPWLAAALLGSCLLVAFLSRRRILIWAALFNVFSILPIAFIVARSGFAFYIPFAGWVIYAAGLLAWLAEMIARPVGRQRLEAIQGVILVLLFVFWIPWHAQHLSVHSWSCRESQERLRGWYNDIRAGLPSTPPRTEVLVLKQPDNLAWNADFLMGLAYDGSTVRVDTSERLKAANVPIRPENYDVLLDYVDGHFRVSRVGRPSKAF